MAFHFNVPGAHAAGRIGVTLFFVLSGYLICSHLLSATTAQRLSIRAFLWRRALRIGPALLVMLSIVTVAAAATSSLPEIQPAILASLLMVANAPAPLGIDLLWLSHAWTLSLEWQFYLVLPGLLLTGLASRVGAAAVIVITLGVLVIYPEASGLGIGCALAIGGARFLGKVWHANLVAAGIALLILSAALDNQSAYYHLVPAWLASIGGGLVVAGAVRGEGLSLGWMSRIGTVSYSLYLWHLPIGTAIFAASEQLQIPWFLGALTAFALSLLVAAISYNFVERPFYDHRATPSLRQPRLVARRVHDRHLGQELAIRP